MAKKDIKNALNKYHVWDSRNISELLPQGEIVDVTITSPPYWNLKDYGSKSQIGFGQTYDNYINDLAIVCGAIYSITKKSGSLWIISDTLKHDGEVKLLPFDMANKLKEVGWILQDIIIWNKDRTLPWSHQGKLRNIFEYITFFSKEKKFRYNLDQVRDITELKEWWIRYPERYSPEGKAPARTWYFPIPRQGSWGNNWVRHFNPLPPRLVERILTLTTNQGNCVLDPFSGSGTVLAQASVMGRNFIGLDLNPEYQKMFEERVLPAIQQMNVNSTKRRQGAKKRRKIFSGLIYALREIKYPKEIVRLYKKAYGDIELNSILVLRGLEEKTINLIFVSHNKQDTSLDFLNQVKAITKRPPLSKYGIQSNLLTQSRDQLTAAFLEHYGLSPVKDLYIYQNGRTYKWNKKIKAKDLLGCVKSAEGQAQNYPLIVSNIEANVDPNSPPQWVFDLESEDDNA